MTAPHITTELLDGKVRVTALGLNKVAISAGGQQDILDPLIVNRIPVELRVYFKRRDNNNGWYSTNMFCYRLDNESFHPQRPATDGQQQKIYRAAVELCEELNETFLRDGEIARMDRELVVLEDRIRQYKDEYAAALTIRDRFAGILI